MIGLFHITMLNKKYKLQDTLDVYISEINHERILITFHRMTTRERKEIITQKVVAEFLALLNGKETAHEILNKLGNFKEEDATNLLTFLQKEHFACEAMNILTNDRYSRQIAYFDDMVMNHSGIESQSLLQNRHVAIIGCGAVTGAIAETLARAGVERFTLVDSKKVKDSDLIRHLFCRLSDIGRNKVDVLSDYLKRINKKIETTTFNEMLIPQTDLDKWISNNIDLVINGCDEPYIGHTSLKLGRYLNKKKIPMYVMGGFDAHLMSSGELVFPPKTPCIDCCQQTFQKALTNWKPTYTDIDDPEKLINSDFVNKDLIREISNIGGSGGLSSMSLFSANLSCLRIIQFLVGDKNFDFKTERYEYLLEQGIFTKFEMLKQKNKCPICNE